MRSLALLTCLFLAAALAAVEVHVDDFLLPVAATEGDKAALRTVQQPAAVETAEVDGLATVRAATAQDAINVVVNERAPGCRQVQFGSGFGYVAVGQGSYAGAANPTATRVAKRAAYLKAYLQAKAELTKTLAGLSTAGRERIRESLATATDETTDSVNLDDRSEETLEQATAALLRGFVVYEVEDDVDANRVLVSIVTTPRTRREVHRPTPGTLEADSLQSALQDVLNEVQAGVVPPVGAKVLRVKGTDTLAFVGFGSEVVRYHENAGVQARLRTGAETAATARAQQALCAALTGETAAWEASLDEQTRTTLTEFETAGDPDAPGVKRIEDARQQFLNVFRQTEEFRSAAGGRVPPGVKTRSWVSADGGTAYAMAVFVPGLEPGAVPPAGRPAGPGAGPVEPGPTGQVTDPADVADPTAPAWARDLERKEGWLYGLGKAAGGEDPAAEALRRAQLKLAQQLVLSVTGTVEATSDLKVLTDEEKDRVRIRDRLIERIRTETEVKRLVGVTILEEETVGGTSWCLVGLDQAVFGAAGLERIAEIDARLQPLVAEPDPLTVDDIREVTLLMPAIREREGLTLMLLAVGVDAPASPLAPGVLHRRLGRLADGTGVRLEGHATAPATRDAVLDTLDSLGLTARQEDDARFELRLREKVLTTRAGAWFKVTLTGFVTVVDGHTNEVLGSLEAKAQDASTASEEEAVERCRVRLIPKLKAELQARVLLIMMGKGAP